MNRTLVTRAALATLLAAVLLVDDASASSAAAAAEGGDSLWPTFWKIVNFSILVGGLVYLLRKPIGLFLTQRVESIRRDLVDAAALRTTAEQQLTTVRARLAELPAELDALRRRGKNELEGEYVRMREATAREREKLLERTRREIELQSRLARRQLFEQTTEAAMRLARTRIEHTITPEDHSRLIDRYAAEVRA
jgi:F-type H+-transporting ATPase subunit b